MKIVSSKRYIFVSYFLSCENDFDDPFAAVTSGNKEKLWQISFYSYYAFDIPVNHR